MTPCAAFTKSAAMIVQAASPKEQRTKSWHKHHYGQHYVMQPVRWSELAFVSHRFASLDMKMAWEGFQNLFTFVSYSFGLCCWQSTVKKMKSRAKNCFSRCTPEKEEQQQDGYGSDIFESSHTDAIQARHLDGKEPIDIPAGLPKVAFYSDSELHNTIGRLRSEHRSAYIRPYKKLYGVIDAFVYESERDEILFLQITTKKNHGIHIAGLNLLNKAMPFKEQQLREDTSTSWKFIFVVPDVPSMEAITVQSLKDCRRNLSQTKDPHRYHRKALHWGDRIINTRCGYPFIFYILTRRQLQTGFDIVNCPLYIDRRCRDSIYNETSVSVVPNLTVARLPEQYGH
ncbi:hypothetical protein BZG36_05680 [Bifiguratus adelaidae]|uniref:Uncharacterized protein n=1 Tax=Bifiguratus adelaidae TaxID=1938954 RepID=A0A261XSW1_9FUNG|nr:hypothetical protein BZG36_05680 [Bifiguratus adelaidae]